MAEGGVQQMVSDWQQRFSRWEGALLALSTAYAARGEAEMKNQAAWTDRTSNARNRLWARAEVFESDSSHFVVGFSMGHGVQYGTWLEFGTKVWTDAADQGNRTKVASTGLMGYPIVHPTAEDIHTPFFEDAMKLLGSG